MLMYTHTRMYVYVYTYVFLIIFVYIAQFFAETCSDPGPHHERESALIGYLDEYRKPLRPEPFTHRELGGPI